MIRDNSDGLFGPVIYSYTRRQAIEDGVLIDLSQHEVIRQHWTVGVACTAAVWQEIEDACRQGSDIAGVLHDLSCCAKAVIKPNVNHHGQVQFSCIVGNKLRHYKLVAGPDDDGVTCLTLMMPTED